MTPSSLELLQQAFYAPSHEPHSGTARWASALRKRAQFDGVVQDGFLALPAMPGGSHSSTFGRDTALMLPGAPSHHPLASLFVAHSLWLHWMRGVHQGERAETASFGSAGPLAKLLQHGRAVLAMEETWRANVTSRQDMVRSVHNVLADTNARCVPNVLSPSGVAVDVALAVGGAFDEVSLAEVPSGSVYDDVAHRATVDPFSVPRGVVLELGDASKFVGDSRLPHVAAQARCALLHADGWTVVHVPTWEWASLDTRQQRQRYLRRKIQKQLLKESE